MGVSGGGQNVETFGRAVKILKVPSLFQVNEILLCEYLKAEKSFMMLAPWEQSWNGKGCTDYGGMIRILQRGEL